MNKLNNPFSDYGKVMSGNRFVGRQAEIGRLQQRVLSKYGGGCAAIVGEARIGKTSLMQYVFNRDDPMLQSINGLVVSFNVGSLDYTSVTDFFVNFVKGIQRELRRKSRDDYDELQMFADELFLSVKSNATDWNILLLEYFQEVGAKGYRVILLLDEFDSISRVFGDNESAFQLLRQLGYEDKYGTAIVTTSRITIGQIEVQSLISTLSGIFTDIHLGLFDETEYNDLFETRLKDSSIQFTNREMRKIRDFAGLYPYFAQVASFHVWDYKAAKRKELVDYEIDMALDTCRAEIYQQFDNFKLRMGIKRFETLLTVTQGPSAYPFSPFDVNRLVQQGHIVEYKNNSDTEYKPFSKIYDEYLKYEHRQIDLWPLWTQTEKALRQLIGNRYENIARQQRTSLKTLLKEKHDFLYEKYCDYERSQQREQRYFSVTTAPFDYMNPGDIFEFLDANWTSFQDIFGPKDRKNEWRNKFSTIRQIRNPYAHSREQVVIESKRKLAESICHEIIGLIAKTGITV